MSCTVLCTVTVAMSGVFVIVQTTLSLAMLGIVIVAPTPLAARI